MSEQEQRMNDRAEQCDSYRRYGAAHIRAVVWARLAVSRGRMSWVEARNDWVTAGYPEGKVPSGWMRCREGETPCLIRLSSGKHPDLAVGPGLLSWLARHPDC
jgi:hypothetical protein